jgi:hypothetical protein
VDNWGYAACAAPITHSGKGIHHVKSETKGSQYFLRYAVNKKRELLLTALLESGATGRREDITWHSPLENDRLGKYREYKDGAAIRLIGLDKKLSAPLAKFWPSRGPVWDALGTGTNGRPILLEAKAHIPEAVSRIKAASKSSIELINKGLALARSRYTRKSQVDWSAPFYQYANRLAYQFWMREQNGNRSSLVFLYFLNAKQMKGPATRQEWLGVARLIHSVLGLPADLRHFGVYDAFLDARQLDQRQ